MPGFFMINYILMDQEFDKIVDKMNLAIVNTCGAREHVTDAERGICTIKTRPDARYWNLGG